MLGIVKGGDGINVKGRLRQLQREASQNTLEFSCLCLESKVAELESACLLKCDSLYVEIEGILG